MVLKPVEFILYVEYRTRSALLGIIVLELRIVVQVLDITQIERFLGENQRIPCPTKYITLKFNKIVGKYITSPSKDGSNLKIPNFNFTK